MVGQGDRRDLKIMIVGERSFIGRNFIKYSQFRSVEEVSLLDRQPGEIDFSPYDIVIHLAAIVHQSRSIPKEKYFKVNRDLCLEVAVKAKNDGVKQFIFMSTSKVYGQFVPESGPMNVILKMHMV